MIAFKDKMYSDLIEVSDKRQAFKGISGKAGNTFSYDKIDFSCFTIPLYFSLISPLCSEFLILRFDAFIIAP